MRQSSLPVSGDKRRPRPTYDRQGSRYSQSRGCDELGLTICASKFLLFVGRARKMQSICISAQSAQVDHYHLVCLRCTHTWYICSLCQHLTVDQYRELAVHERPQRLLPVPWM